MKSPFNQKVNKDPLVFVDINFGGDDKRRIALYEDSNPDKLAYEFVVRNNLEE